MDLSKDVEAAVGRRGILYILFVFIQELKFMSNEN